MSKNDAGVWSAADFVDLGPRGAIDLSLHRLVPPEMFVGSLGVSMTVREVCLGFLGVRFLFMALLPDRTLGLGSGLRALAAVLLSLLFFPNAFLFVGYG
jgi:hypothetical protein